jgi:lysophospholipase L1-like esterase
MRYRSLLPALFLVAGLALSVSCSHQEPAQPARAAATATAPVATNRNDQDFRLVTQQTAGVQQLILPSDPRFRYEGRFDTTNAAGPVIIWQGSRIAIDFEGSLLVLRFERLQGQTFFDIAIDGTNHLLAIRGGEESRFVFQPELGAERHRLTLFKRSEADAGTVRFKGIEIAAGAQVWLPAEPDYRLAMVFFGDSITVGACNEDGDTDQWDDRLTHNNALSYAALTASAFSADYRNIAVSGMGVATGWFPLRAGQVWDRLYPSAASPPADLSAWKPDVVFVNLGENDDSYSTAKGKLFPTVFAREYVELIRAIREAYPAAQIVLLRGGMFGGSQSTPLREAWESAVAELERHDPKIAHFVFTHWSKNHPRVADDRAMAEELIAWLKKQKFMRPR